MPEKYEREIEEILAKSSKDSKRSNANKSLLNMLFRYLINQSELGISKYPQDE